METDLLTPREVATLLRCNIHTVGNYRRAGRLRFEKHSPRSYRYYKTSVEEFRQQSTPKV